MSNSDTVTKSIYRPEIDGLRAIAVLAVVLYHIDESWIPSGFLGVDIFFVISGFVITKSISNRNEINIGTFLQKFYLRRIKRLLPALLLCVITTSAFAWFANPEPGVSFVTGGLSLLGFSNIYLYSQAMDYFAAPAQLNHFTHTWSLAVEEQFYLVYPVLFYLLAFGKNPKPRTFTILFTVSALSFLSLMSYVYFSYTNEMAAFFLAPMRFWELGAGCALAMILKRGPSDQKSSLVGNPVWPLIMLMVLLLLPSLNIFEKRIYPNTIACVFATVWLIAALSKTSNTKRMLSSGPFVYIGKISYSLYLWHWSILTIVAWKIDLTFVSIPFIVAAMFLISVFSYHFIEKPLRHADWSKSPSASLGYGLGSSVLAMTLLMGSALSTSRPAIDVEPKTNTTMTSSVPTEGGEFTEPSWRNLKIIQKSMECHSPLMENPISYCLTRSTDQSTIFVLGDSHGSNLVPSLIEATNGKDWSVLYLGDRGVRYPEMAKKISHLKNQVRPGDMVVFSMWRDRVYHGARKKFENESREGNENLGAINSTRKALIELKGMLEEREAKLILVDDIPALCSPSRFEVLKSQRQIKKCASDREVSKADRKPLTVMFKEVVGEENYLDPHDALCPEETCTAFVGETPLFGDGASHFSTQIPAPLEDFFRERLDLSRD